jgi:hypothetical protein
MGPLDTPNTGQQDHEQHNLGREQSTTTKTKETGEIFIKVAAVATLK